MTTAGLAEMGWKVTVDELAERRDEAPTAEPTVEDDEMTARRKRAISGGA